MKVPNPSSIPTDSWILQCTYQTHKHQFLEEKFIGILILQRVKGQERTLREPPILLLPPLSASGSEYGSCYTVVIL